MIPVDLSVNCEGWIYDPNGSGIQVFGIRSRGSFSGSTDMSAKNVKKICSETSTAEQNDSTDHRHHDVA